MQKETTMPKLHAFLRQLTDKRRRRYKEKKQKRLKNTKPTIIGNNCVCGTIYRDLDLQYTSPTTDVLIHAADFFPFVENLEYYLTCVPEEIFLDGVSYPVGVLKNGDKQVVLRFMHEHSFQVARDKWVRRCKRVDLDNVYIIFHLSQFRKCLRKSSVWYKRFKQLKHPNKRMLMNAWFAFDPEVTAIPKTGFYPNKQVLQYPTQYSKKRLLDHFDYVSFLNQRKK